MMRAALLLLSLLVTFCLPVQGEIYKWVMPDGSIQYSDQPQAEGATEAELPPLQLYTAPPTPPPASTADEGTEKAARDVGYEVLEFVSPASGEVIRDNGGTVSVQLKLVPSLRSGHKVEIMLDGKAVGSGRATSASLTNLDRGSHSLSAVVKDDSGGTVASAPAVSFQLKRSSKLQPRRKPVPTPKASN